MAVRLFLSLMLPGLLLAGLAGCRGLGSARDNGEDGKTGKDAKPARDAKDKSDSAYRLHGTKQPDLFPADLVSGGPRPQPEVRKEDIRPAGGLEEKRSSPASDPPLPLPSPPAPGFGAGVPRLLEKTPLEPREPVVDALHSIFLGKHNEAVELLKRYDPATQELFLRLLPPIAQLSHKSLDKLSPTEVAVLHEQLNCLILALRPRTELSIDRLCFVESVSGFGDYRPLPEGHVFVASTRDRPGDRAQIYVELRNFASEPRGGVFETRLETSLEIHDQRGVQVVYLRFDDRPIQARSLLHDHHGHYAFQVPQMPAGTYKLTIQITDKTRADIRRVARKSLEFRVSTIGK